MHRQSVIYLVIAIVALILVAGLVATKGTHQPAPAVAPSHLPSAESVPPAKTPCVPPAAGEQGARGSTTNTATTPQGTTPDGRPTGAFVGQPCEPGTGVTPGAQPGR